MQGLLTPKDGPFPGFSVTLSSGPTHHHHHTIRTFLCFELEQIRGHFASWGPPIFVGRSGLKFALTHSIAEIQHSWDIFNYWVTLVISRLCFELEQIRDHFAQQIWGVLRKQSGLRFALTQSIKKLCVAAVVVGGARQQSDVKFGNRPSFICSTILRLIPVHEDPLSNPTQGLLL